MGATASRVKELLLGVYGKVSEHGLTDRAAALTYYGFLSLFPALIVAVALLGLLGSYPETYRSIVSTLREAAPGTAVDVVDSALKDALRSRGTAQGLLGIGLLISLYSASSAVGAALRAVEAIYSVPQEGRPWWRGYTDRFKLTLAVALMLLVAFLAMLVAGPAFSSIADAAGINASVSKAVSLARWPIGIGALICAALLIYRAGAGRPIGLRALLPGAAAAAGLWVVASFGFNIYVSHFGSYDATYGTLGALIVLLVWMWIGNLALLCGSALNLELEQGTGRLDRSGRE